MPLARCALGATLAAFCFCLALSPALAARKAAQPAPSAAVPAGVQSKDVVPANTEGLTASTYAFLRKSSDRVGEAVANVLGVQQNLDEMKEDLSGEYSRWINKKTALVADNTRVKDEIKRLQAELLRQKAQQEEKLRLENVLAIKTSEGQKIAFAAAEARKKWAIVKQGMENDVKYYEIQQVNVSDQRLALVAVAANRTNDIRDENVVMQQKIFHLNRQCLYIEEIISKDLLNSTKHRDGLVQQVDTIQKEVHGLQAEMLQQAKLEAEILTFRKRLAAQAEEVKEQRHKLTEFRTECEQDLRNLDGQIATSTQDMAKVTSQLMACQALDGENQRLEVMLNQCKVLTRSIR